MAIQLPVFLEDLVKEKVAAGPYATETEVVSSALELLKLHDSSPAFRKKMLLAALDEGEADIKAGRYITLNSPDEIDAFVASLTEV
jgi:Arc/MetJ-type ribon-helix-helix transcriptional regulator